MFEWKWLYALWSMVPGRDRRDDFVAVTGGYGKLTARLERRLDKLEQKYGEIEQKYNELLEQHGECQRENAALKVRVTELESEVRTLRQETGSKIIRGRIAGP